LRQRADLEQIPPTRPAEMPGKSMSLVNRLRLGPKARLAMSIVLLGLLLSYVDLRTAFNALRNVDPWLIALCTLIIAVGRILVAYRWHLLVRVGNAAVGLGALIRLIFVSSFLSAYMPGAIGVELLRIYGLARGTTLALAVSSVLVERLTALCALAALALLGLALAPVDLPQEVSMSAGIVCALVTGTLIALFIPPVRDLLLIPFQGRALGPLRRRLGRIFEQIDHYRARPRLLAWLALLSVAVQLLRVLEKIVLAPALGIDIHIMYFFVLVPVALFVTLLPISIQGLGVREAVYVVLLGAIGVDSAAALALSLLGFLLATAVNTVPGALLYARGGLALSKMPTQK
jgi:glycosyltransferase 2 family protein